MTPQQIDQIVSLASDWVAQQRSEHRTKGTPLQGPALTLFGAYYDPPDLEAVRWLVVPQIENPPFRDAVAAQLAAEGLPAIDFSKMAGITFVDTVLLSKTRCPVADIESVLLHEMAHVVQYRLMGLARFIHDYVWGLANNSFDYFKIPLEQQACAIQARAAKGERFRVEPVLREMLQVS